MRVTTSGLSSRICVEDSGGCTSATTMALNSTGGTATSVSRAKSMVSVRSSAWIVASGVRRSTSPKAANKSGSSEDENAEYATPSCTATTGCPASVDTRFPMSGG
ncbi:hypothetical protein MTO96_009287 [Rhipicephalus appendiculatus]